MKVYIDWLNKDNNFKRERKEFETYEAAVLWGRENLSNFSTDSINYLENLIEVERGEKKLNHLQKKFGE